MKIELKNQEKNLPKLGDLLNTEHGFRLITQNLEANYSMLDLITSQIVYNCDTIESLLENYNEWEIVDCKLIIEN